MSREAHVRFCEGVEVRFLRATRPVAESFFGIMKTELVYHEQYEGHQDTLHSIFEYIEAFYNRERRHSTLGYLSPAEYEKQKLRKCA